MLVGGDLDAGVPARLMLASAVIASVPILIGLPAELDLSEGRPLPRSIFER